VSSAPAAEVVFASVALPLHQKGDAAASTASLSASAPETIPSSITTFAT